MTKDEWFEKTGYTPHAEQKEFHDSDARFRLIVAGRRWGQTLSLTKEAEVMLMEPGTKGWVVGETYQMVMAILSAMRRNMEDVGKSPCGSYIQDLILEYPWGSTVEGRIAQHPETLPGEHDVDWIVFDNCAHSKSEVWDICRASLKEPRLVAVSQRWYKRLLQRVLPFWFKKPMRGLEPGGKMVLATTPQGTNWVYELWRTLTEEEAQQVDVSPDKVTIISSGWVDHRDWWTGTFRGYHEETDEYLEKCRRDMSEREFNQNILGKFVPEYDPYYDETLVEKAIKKFRKVPDEEKL